MRSDSPGVVALRGGHVESFHRIHAAVVDGEGRLRGRVGDPRLPVLLRSAAKPLQALPLVEDGVMEALGLTPRDLALACASHGGEPEHVEGVRRMLERAGIREEELACGPGEPLDPGAARGLLRSGREPGRIHNNCSGKHAGMAALAIHRGWSRAGYHEEGHPVQERMRQVVARWSEVPWGDVATATDGCGVRTFRVPLAAAARAYARLGRASAPGRASAVGSPAAEVVRAMTAHPFLVGGSGRLCTRLMELGAGGTLVKVGAEGIYGAWAGEPGIGVALKVEDGARRAADPALLEVLRASGAVGDAELDALEGFRAPPVRNSRGEVVGALEADLRLEPVR